MVDEFWSGVLDLPRLDSGAKPGTPRREYWYIPKPDQHEWIESGVEVALEMGLQNREDAMVFIAQNTTKTYERCWDFSPNRRLQPGNICRSPVQIIMMQKSNA